ncbi:hypothetical protein Hamer_G007927 [Homarus americanus]|uniref:Uncharacterized protein n=1 Tax=Homarus americanus TaxID=6706 RepID=A0A8J5JZQ5_HOMAM|nr:hypothetical protein Hamer_G007927 [Homarus americanus]
MPRRRYRRVSDEDRDGLITRYEAGEDFLDTAAELRIPRTTEYERIRKFVETGENRNYVDEEDDDHLCWMTRRRTFW